MADQKETRYEGDFLEAIDLPECVEVPAVIEAVVEQGVEKDGGGKVINRKILAFKGKHKRMILNKTNYRVLKTLFGPDAAKWIGGEVMLQKRYLDAKHGFGVNNELCVRIIPPKGTPLPKSVRDFMGKKTPYPAG